MSTQEVFVQQFAKLFDHYRIDFVAGRQNPPPNMQIGNWNAIPSDERNRMVAAARLALLELETTGRTEDRLTALFRQAG